MCLLCLQMLAQHKLRGFCKDESNNQYVSDVSVLLMTTDSVVICQTTSVKMLGQFVLNVDTTGTFLLHLSHKDYEHRYTRVTLPIADANKVPIYKLSPKAEVMDEVVVNATHHDVTMRKDTLVYNAESFVVPDGYSIRALLSQFPGLEITKDNKIQYNGRDVKYFLINGKEYMMNQPQVALDNLPAEYIDTVKIYGYTTQQDRLAKDSTLEKPLAIDLNVKKEHRGQWMFNGGAAGGHKGYYRVRAFATKMLPTLDVTVYGSSNNYMHSSDYYGQNVWSDQNSYVGHGSDTPIGVSLRWENGKPRSEKGWMELNAKVDYKNYNVTSPIASEILSFYDRQPEVTESGWLTERIHSNSVNASFRMQWNTTENTYLEYNGEVGVDKDRGSMSEENEVLSVTDSTSTRKLLEENKSYDLRKVSIDNSLSYTIGYKKKGRVTKFGLSNKLKPPQESLSEGVQTISLYQSSALATVNKRIIRLDDKLGTEVSFSETISHSEPLGHGWSMDLKQKWDWSNVERTYDYIVDGVLEEENSYVSRRNNSILKLTPTIRYSKGVWRLSTYAEVIGDFSTLQHQQDRIDTLLGRDNKFCINYNAKGTYMFSDRHSLSLTYSYTRSRPELLDLLPIIDTRNPTTIFINNTQRKDGYTNKLEAIWSRFLPKREIDLSMESSFSIRGNYTLHTKWYDQKTGVETSSNIDVDGMWDSHSMMRYSMRLGKKGRLRLISGMGLDYKQSKDALVDIFETTPSTIHGWRMPLNASLRYTLKPKDLSLATSIMVSQYWGYRNGGSSPITRSATYALAESMTCKLPWKIDMVADLGCRWKDTQQSHTVNKFRTIANLSLSRSFLKDNALNIKLECHDIFNTNDQWDTVTNPNWVSSLYTEMITNYIMLHINYQITL